MMAQIQYPPLNGKQKTSDEDIPFNTTEGKDVLKLASSSRDLLSLTQALPLQVLSESSVINIHKSKKKGHNYGIDISFSSYYHACRTDLQHYVISFILYLL